MKIGYLAHIIQLVVNEILNIIRCIVLDEEFNFSAAVEPFNAVHIDFNFSSTLQKICTAHGGGIHR